MNSLRRFKIWTGVYVIQDPFVAKGDCPIIAAYRKRYPSKPESKIVNNNDARWIAFELGLSQHDANEIIHAADNWTSPILRQRLIALVTRHEEAQ